MNLEKWLKKNYKRNGHKNPMTQLLYYLSMMKRQMRLKYLMNLLNLQMEMLLNLNVGYLQMFKLKEPTESFPARPSEEECVLVRSCPPKEGCMVVFRNTFDSYHAVGQMSGHSQDRDFLYGGVTQLGGINPNMQHARDDMPTEFGLYT